MPKCDFIEITLRYGCFSCKFAAYFQQTFPQTSKDVSQLTHVVVRNEAVYLLGCGGLGYNSLK